MRTAGGKALAEARGRLFVDILPVDLSVRPATGAEPTAAAVVERLRADALSEDDARLAGMFADGRSS